MESSLDKSESYCLEHYLLNEVESIFHPYGLVTEHLRQVGQPIYHHILLQDDGYSRRVDLNIFLMKTEDCHRKYLGSRFWGFCFGSQKYMYLII